MDYDGLLELVKKRRTIRRFKPDQIPDEYVEKIIEVARWAPSAYNSQPWDFVVVKREDLRRKIVEIILDFPPASAKEEDDVSEAPNRVDPLEKLMTGTKAKPQVFLNAPVYVILYGDRRARTALPGGLNQGSEEKYVHVFMASLANAFMYMHLAASSLGLAAQWVTKAAFEPAHSEIKELLGIPQELVAFDMMVLGYPDAVPRPKLLRPMERMLHYDDCGIEDFRTLEEVDDFGKRTKAWTTGQHRREQMR